MVNGKWVSVCRDFLGGATNLFNAKSLLHENQDKRKLMGGKGGSG